MSSTRRMRTVVVIGATSGIGRQAALQGRARYAPARLSGGGTRHPSLGWILGRHNWRISGIPWSVDGDIHRSMAQVQPPGRCALVLRLEACIDTVARSAFFYGFHAANHVADPAAMMAPALAAHPTAGTEERPPSHNQSARSPSPERS